MRVDASKPKTETAASAEKIQDPMAQAPATPAPEVLEPATPEAKPAAPPKILFAETIGTDGKIMPAHEAELGRIAERAQLTKGRDPHFKQKQFADWHGWCHWRASLARVQIALHQADADRWEARKKGRDLDREQAVKAKIEAEVRKINAERAKLGKPPLTVEQAAVLLS